VSRSKPLKIHFRCTYELCLLPPGGRKKTPLRQYSDLKEQKATVPGKSPGGGSRGLSLIAKVPIFSGRSSCGYHEKCRRPFILRDTIETSVTATSTSDNQASGRQEAPSIPGTLPVVVVIPALNEERSIGEVVRSLPRTEIHEIVVVDNGSTDRTAAVASEAGATVLREGRKGYGYACLLGIERAERVGAEVVAFVDGDLSDYPEELPSILEPILKHGFEMVIGSRMTGEREPGAMLPQAVFGNWLATRLIRLFWGYSFTDLGPFRAIRADALRAMNMSDPTYGWTVEMQIKAAKLGLRCTEVPVRYRRRIGTSKVTGTIRGTIGASVKILYMIAKQLVAGPESLTGREARMHR
jgi:hypothetical protein